MATTRKLSPEYKWTPTGGMKVNNADGKTTYPANALFDVNLFTGKAHKNVSKYATVLEKYLNAIKHNPDLTFGQYLDANKISLIKFQAKAPFEIRALKANSPAKDVSHVLNLLNKKIAHRRAKMLQGKLTVLTDFLTSSEEHSKTFADYLKSCNMPQNVFFAGMPENLKDKKIFDMTQAEIAPYIHTVNMSNMKQLAAFSQTAPDNIKGRDVLKEFHKDVVLDDMSFTARGGISNQKISNTTITPPPINQSLGNTSTLGNGTLSSGSGSGTTITNQGGKTVNKFVPPTNPILEIAPLPEYAPPVNTYTPPATSPATSPACSNAPSGGGCSSMPSGCCNNQPQCNTQQWASQQQCCNNVQCCCNTVDDTAKDACTYTEQQWSASGNGGNPFKTWLEGLHLLGNETSKDVKAVGKDIKKINIHAIISEFNKFNPVTLLTRAAILGCLDINLFDMATDWGKVESMKDQTHYKKVGDIWTTLGGDPNLLSKSIDNGKRKKQFMAAGGCTTTPSCTTKSCVSPAAATAAVGAGSGAIAAGVTAATGGTAAPVAVPVAGVITAITPIVDTALKEAGQPASKVPKDGTKAGDGLDPQTKAALAEIAKGNKTGNLGDSLSKVSPKVWIGAGLGILALVAIVGMAGRSSSSSAPSAISV